MEIEEGVIEKVTKRKAWVRIQQSSACATCESRGTCDVTSEKRLVIEVANDLQAKIGDRVQLSIPESSLLKLSFLVYFLPVLALLVGAILGERLAPFFDVESTPAAVIGGGFCMVIVFSVLKWFDRGSKFKEKYYPRMTRILFSAAAPSHDDSR